MCPISQSDKLRCASDALSDAGQTLLTEQGVCRAEILSVNASRHAMFH